MATKPKQLSGYPPTIESVAGDIRLGSRICIYGRGGKTTLSRALGDLTGLPVIELDAIFWLPNWVERDSDEMREIVLNRLAQPANLERHRSHRQTHDIQRITAQTHLW